MLITRTSPISGTTHSLEINCTREQLEAWESGTLIQNAMPNVDAPLREFIKAESRRQNGWKRSARRQDRTDNAIVRLDAPAGGMRPQSLGKPRLFC